MAVTYRFPVCVWQDHDGWFTATLLEWDEPAGIGRSAQAALHQVREYLEWMYEERPWLGEPDLLDPRLQTFRVPVRPEYRSRDRRFPCDDSLNLRVWGVTGRQEHGALVCVLPTLPLRFYYYRDSNLKSLVQHYVQQFLEGKPPQQLSRFLPPAAITLEQAVITVRNREPRQRAWQPSFPALEAVAEPLGEPRVRGQFSRPYERDAQVADLVRRLGKERVNVILLGDSGCGKTTVLVEAVRQLEHAGDDASEEKPRGKLARKYWQTSGGRLIAGMKYLGQWEERCEEIIAELATLGGVLCVDSLLDLIREGGVGPNDSLASFFLPYLQRGELRMVAEATPAELDACRRLLPGLADVFQVLRLEPFTRAQAIVVLERVSEALKQNYQLEVGRGVIDLVYHLHHRFLPYQAFPGPATAFLGRLFEKARQEKLPPVEIDQDRVIREFVRQTGLPEQFLRDETPLLRASVLEHFRKQIIGQEEGCQAAANLVTTFKAGLNDPHRPVGVLLFCGPTGVGKTEMARAISRYFFGHGEQAERLVRLDMSEYAGFGAAERLIAQPDGQPSELVKKLRQQPFVVVLLDEIEKASPDVFDALLNVFDEGRLTDRYGRLTTFRSAIIIMTSNLGAGREKKFGFTRTEGVPYEAEAMAFFRPEFFNRIDAVVTFQPLSAEIIRQITRKELSEIAAREGLSRLSLTIEWSDSLVEKVAREGFDARYGARPLQRTLETLVVTPLARFLLEHPQLHNARLMVDVDAQGNVTFSR